MKLRLKRRFPALVLAILALIIAVPVLAQDASTDDMTGTNTISYGGFSFSYPMELGSSVLISQIPGDAADLEVPGGPRPPQVVFSIFNELPEGGVEFGPNVIRVFNTRDVQQYELANAELADLQNLLATDVDLVEYTQVNADGITQELPYINPIAGAQTVIGLPKYVQGNGLRGIAYVTAYRLDVYPFLADSFVYVFQGVSDDGQYAVSASFNVTTDLFEAEVPEDFDYDAFSADYTNYLTTSRETLNAAAPTSFTPSLDTLDQVIGSITLSGDGIVVDAGGATPDIEGDAQVAPGATAEPTEIVDATFGGLGATQWTLTGFGDPAAQTARLPETSVIVTFSEQGVTGNAGCNTFGGEFNYTNDGSLTVGNLITTRLACEEAIMQQENAFLSALQRATRFAVDDRGQLLVFYTEEDGVERQLTFTSPEAQAATLEVTPEATLEITPEVTPAA
jgi:heat shock protein HslJ